MLIILFFIASFSILLGFCGLYHTSKKVSPQKHAVVSWCQARRKWIKPLALLLVLLGCYGFCYTLGLGLGLTFGFILLMTCSSIQILYLPFKRGRNAG